LQHPHIVAVHEVGEREGQCFFTMDFVEGQSLAALVRRAPVKGLPTRTTPDYTLP
jgi:serine/threonine-protein kinase